MMYLLLLLGFVFLVKGADLFVDGSSSLAKTMRIPAVVIGLTIVAMGTSAPEASVSINAALVGNNDIAVSNVIGSNLFNSLMVVGVCAIIAAFKVDKEILRRDFYVNIVSTIALCVMMLDGKIERWEGIVLLICLVIYLVTMIRSAMANRLEADEIEAMPLPKSFLYIAVGLVLIIWGGNLVVNNASLIATTFGLSQNFIGLTIVAMGTSLPELVTSVVAAKKGESGLALGNAVGSNLFNILFILGMSSTVCPLVVLNESVIDVAILIFVAISLFVMARTKEEMTAKEGFICVLMYAAYMAYILMR